MIVFLAIFSALLPVGLLLWYIYRQDSMQPEPVKWLWKSVLYGAISVIAALALATPFEILLGLLDLSDISKSVAGAFLEAAFPEEAAKMLMLCLVLRRNPYFDEHLDGVVYATCVGLGFAAVENVMYVLQSLPEFVSTAVMRGLFAVPGHFFFAVAMGYFISIAHFSSSSARQKKGLLLNAYLIPVLIHGIYDSLLELIKFLPAISVLLVFVFLFFCHKMRKISQKRIRAMKARDEEIRRKDEIAIAGFFGDQIKENDNNGN